MDTDGSAAFYFTRTHFAFTDGFHIIFPAITIGLASFVAVLRLKTCRATYRDRYHFGSKISAVNFGIGVASGVVMAYQFGTTWSRFTWSAGGITDGRCLPVEIQK